MFFDRIYVDDKKIVERGKNLNNSPKFYAKVTRSNSAYAVEASGFYFNSVCHKTDLSRSLEMSDGDLDVLKLLRQVKIEFTGQGVKYYDFSFTNILNSIIPTEGLVQVKFSFLKEADTINQKFSKLSKENSRGSFYVKSAWEKTEVSARHRPAQRAD
jgi:hypothetical protein